MSIRENRLLKARHWKFVLVFLLAGCDSDMSDDPIPNAVFADFIVNLAFPEYQSLMVDGGFKELNSIGVRGVILYRKNQSTFLAFERNCSYHPNEACATVNVHTSQLFMHDPCCGSNFSFEDGTPTGGVAWRPLRQYRTEASGPFITVTDEVL